MYTLSTSLFLFVTLRLVHLLDG